MSRFLFFCLGISLLLAIGGSPFASEHPDGLERVAEDHHFDGKATEVWRKAPLPDYAAPIAAFNPAFQTGVAGGIGALLVFAVLFGAGRLLQGNTTRSA